MGSEVARVVANLDVPRVRFEDSGFEKPRAAQVVEIRGKAVQQASVDHVDLTFIEREDVEVVADFGAFAYAQHVTVALAAKHQGDFRRRQPIVTQGGAGLADKKSIETRDTLEEAQLSQDALDGELVGWPFVGLGEEPAFVAQLEGGLGACVGITDTQVVDPHGGFSQHGLAFGRELSPVILRVDVKDVGEQRQQDGEKREGDF